MSKFEQVQKRKGRKKVRKAQEWDDFAKKYGLKKDNRKRD